MRQVSLKSKKFVNRIPDETGESRARVTTLIHGFRRRATGIPVIAALCLLITCAAICFAVRASNPKAANCPSIEGTTPVLEYATRVTKPASVAQVPKGSVEVEIVTLREWGFEPKSITRPKGRFFLAVNNQSQLTEQLTFSMAHEVGNRLKEDRLDWRARHRWNNIFELNPGRYKLTVLEHPEWVCDFSITAK